MPKIKTFDCVEMKRRGAEALLERTGGLSLEEELAFWRERERETQETLAASQEKQPRRSLAEFRTWLDEQVEAFHQEQAG